MQCLVTECNGIECEFEVDKKEVLNYNQYKLEKNTYLYHVEGCKTFFYLVMILKYFLVS